MRFSCYNVRAVRDTEHAAIAQQVERILGKDEVSSSNLDSSSNKNLSIFGSKGFLFFSPSSQTSALLVALLVPYTKPHSCTNCLHIPLPLPSGGTSPVGRGKWLCGNFKQFGKPEILNESEKGEAVSKMVLRQPRLRVHYMILFRGSF